MIGLSHLSPHTIPLPGNEGNTRTKQKATEPHRSLTPTIHHRRKKNNIKNQNSRKNNITDKQAEKTDPETYIFLSIRNKD